MKISVLTPDVSHNCLGRAYLLARVLQRRYEVEIIGPALRGAVWQPLASQDEIEVRVVPVRRQSFQSMALLTEIRGEVTGDVIYASKPVLTSYGAGLIEKRRTGCPLVLDIDDWQMGFRKQTLRRLRPLRRLMSLCASLVYLARPSSYWNTLLMDAVTGWAEQITVSGSFLREKYGGTIIWHARDTHTLRPNGAERYLGREWLEVNEDQQLVMFLGTPHPYKGVGDLAKAVGLLSDEGVVLSVIGVTQTGYSQQLRRLARDRLSPRSVRLVEPQPVELRRRLLAAADLIVIPQRRNYATVGQVPAKVFDAMAMAKPIIATNVSDLPKILDGCGWIVEPEQPISLAETMRYVLDSPEEASTRGLLAREKCVSCYSWDAMQPVLASIFDRYT